MYYLQKKQRKSYFRKKLSWKQNKTKQSAAVGSVWMRKTTTIVPNTGAVPSLVEADCLSRAWARNAVTMKAAHLQTTKNTKLKAKRAIELEIQLRKRVAEACRIVVTNLATVLILRTAYIDGNIVKSSSKKNTLKPTASIPDTMEEDVGNDAYAAHRAQSKHGYDENEYNEHPCTAIIQRSYLQWAKRVCM